jgi:hypothetical protein
MTPKHASEAVKQAFYTPSHIEAVLVTMAEVFMIGSTHKNSHQSGMLHLAASIGVILVVSSLNSFREITPKVITRAAKHPVIANLHRSEGYNDPSSFVSICNFILELRVGRNNGYAFARPKANTPVI